MNYLTGGLASQVRQELGLSQSKVSRETGINRAYLSEFEGDKRVLNDSQLSLLCKCFSDYGWTPDSEQSESTAENMIKDEKCGLQICDGFVVSVQDDPSNVEWLLEEYHSLEVEISAMLSQKLEMGFLGLSIDEDAAKDRCIEALLLIARREELISLLQGRSDLLGESQDYEAANDLKSVGDYLNAMLSAQLPDRYLPAR